MKPSKIYTGCKGEFFTEPSLTVPDMTMSMRTIMERYAKGLPIDNQKTPIYDIDEMSEGVDLRKLDLVDIQEMTEKHKEVLNAHKEETEKKRSKKERDEFEELVNTRVQNALNKQ